MKNVRINDLIEFKRSTDKRKQSFAKRLKEAPKEEKDGGGGDYWISCTSAIEQTFKTDDKTLLEDRITSLSQRIDDSDTKRVKERHQRNLDIVTSFLDFDFDELRPKAELKFQKKPKEKSIIHVKEFPLVFKPSNIFTFSTDNRDEIGSIWFVPKINGFKKDELGMFTDLIHRSLHKYYSKDYFVNSKYCIAVDITNGQIVSYADIEDDTIPVLIDQTIDEINNQISS